MVGHGVGVDVSVGVSVGVAVLVGVAVGTVAVGVGVPTIIHWTLPASSAARTRMLAPGMNPSVTQIPDAHFLFEARYNGAQLTVIDPIYSATAIHADHWLPLKPGTDAGLALATARHIWATGRINLDYVREQTDFPILVRLDTGRFLRQSDLEEGGKDNILYMWDPAKKAAVPAPGCEGDRNSKIGLGDLVPPIEGLFEVRLKGGAKVQVVPVGALVSTTQ